MRSPFQIAKVVLPLAFLCLQCGGKTKETPLPEGALDSARVFPAPQDSVFAPAPEDAALLGGAWERALDPCTPLTRGQIRSLLGLTETLPLGLTGETATGVRSERGGEGRKVCRWSTLPVGDGSGVLTVETVDHQVTERSIGGCEALLKGLSAEKNWKGFGGTLKGGVGKNAKGLSTLEMGGMAPGYGGCLRLTWVLPKGGGDGSEARLQTFLEAWERALNPPVGVSAPMARGDSLEWDLTDALSARDLAQASGRLVSGWGVVAPGVWQAELGHEKGVFRVERSLYASAAEAEQRFAEKLQERRDTDTPMDNLTAELPTGSHRALWSGVFAVPDANGHPSALESEAISLFRDQRNVLVVRQRFEKGLDSRAALEASHVILVKKILEKISIGN